METKTIAETIAQQIGNQAFAMMGAKNLLQSDRYLDFKIGRNAKGVTHVRVTLDRDDTYTVGFTSFRKVKGRYVSRDLGEASGVYFDGLHAVLEARTGLYMSLGTMGR